MGTFLRVKNFAYTMLFNLIVKEVLDANIIN